jgi:hypothetical protein
VGAKKDAKNTSGDLFKRLFNRVVESV